ncbi:MAG: RES domain-containing protein [Acetobacteraceae bacterium]
MRLYRVASARHPVWDGAGAALSGGRWNPPGMPVIYAAGSLSLAMLERLVQRTALRRTLLVEAVVPDDLAIEDLMADPPANWRAMNSPEAARAGGAWAASGRTVLLRVPSVVVPREANYLINPLHQDAARITVGAPEELEWDTRLFGPSARRARTQ